VMRDDGGLLAWRRTWHDTPSDGVGTHPDWPGLKARVYQEPGGTRWAWFVSEIYFIDRGIEDSKDAAKSAAEEAAAAWMERRSALHPLFCAFAANSVTHVADSIQTSRTGSQTGKSQRPSCSKR